MNSADFTRLGFDQYQATDLQILMNLKSPEDISEWMQAVGAKDVQYGMNLLYTAAQLQILADIDKTIDNMPADSMSMAKNILDRF